MNYRALLGYQDRVLSEYRVLLGSDKWGIRMRFCSATYQYTFTLLATNTFTFVGTQRCFVCLPGTTRRFGTCKAAAHASALVASVGQRGAVRRAGGGALVVGSNFDKLGCTTTQCAHRSIARHRRSNRHAACGTR